LIYHGTGVGKTCTGISIAENFRDIYSNNDKKIIILASKNIVENWKNNILNPSKDENQCTGNTYLSLINNKSQLNKKPITKNMINKTINNYYEFYGYQKFANIIKNKMDEYSKTEVGEKCRKIKIKSYQRLLFK
jgi:Type III restriction enzyme, res subunit.